MTTDTAAKLAKAWDPRTDRKAYIVWMAIVAAAIFAGFGLDLSNYLAERPAPPLVMHLHAVVYVAWLGLVWAQIFLVERGDIKLHRRLGWATAAVALVMAPLGLTAAMVDEARRISLPSSDPQFLGLEFGDVLCFAAFTLCGLLLRRDPAAHKRLMILSAVALSDAGFGRAWGLGVKLTLPGPFGWWVQYYGGIALILVAMAGWDLWRRGRVHPAVIGGAALLLTEEITAATLFFNPAWKTLMTGLVKAWGYVG